MDRKYVIGKYTGPSTSLRHLDWQINDDTITLSWDWAIEREVRFALVFRHDAEPICDIETLINENHPHEVVVRDLASRYMATITEGRSKFTICSARFDDNKTISICPPAIVTDWIYKKADVHTHVSYKPLQFSRYQKVDINVKINDTDQAELLTKVLSYEICEHGHTAQVYPLDMTLINDGGHLYITKSQSVRFTLDQNYAHLFEMS